MSSDAVIEPTPNAAPMTRPSAIASTKIAIEHVYKIFGDSTDRALALARSGSSKQEILAETGQVLGIKDVSLKIGAGETFVIMGLSGSGKSTLLRHINRLIEPSAGRIVIDDVDITGLGQTDLIAVRRRKISMVFQHFGLLPHKRVLENVAYGLATRGLSLIHI